ncbi:MAG: UDP-N-acetylmuramoyl-L-alanine--D-glutamate ligase [Gammaproteobacteria bacterium]
MKLIIGFGKTGLSAARYFERNNVPYAINDSRELPPCLSQCDSKVTVVTGKFSPALIKKAEEIILTPGISPKLPEFEGAQEKIINDIELFAREAQAPVIAVTGSNGKTTVTSLTAAMLQSAGYRVLVGGNIGTPVLDLLEEPTPDFYVLELSSFQLAHIKSLKTKAAVVLNISEDHLDYHQTMEHYIQTKCRVYEHCQYAVVNLDDNYLVNQTIGFSETKHPGQFGLESGVLFFGDTRICDMSDLQIKGKHNALNALAALALCYAAGVPWMSVLPGLKSFKGIPHRCEVVAKINDVQWINDSKGTNVAATIAALDGLSSAVDGRILLIAGGKGKGADFHPLGMVGKYKIAHVFLIGESAKLLEEVFMPDVEVTHCERLEDAVHKAHAMAMPHDAVLLSPACASFDMFENYEARGDAFKAAVRTLV